jgi:hypothetical protein
MKPLQSKPASEYRQTVTGTDQGHAAFEDAVGQHRKLIRLAAGEVSQVFFVASSSSVNTEEAEALALSDCSATWR